MSEEFIYEQDEDGNHVRYHGPSGYWFSYHNSMEEAFKGKGRTKQEAIQNSIRNNMKDKK